MFPSTAWCSQVLETRLIQNIIKSPEALFVLCVRSGRIWAVSVLWCERRNPTVLITGSTNNLLFTNTHFCMCEWNHVAPIWADIISLYKTVSRWHYLPNKLKSHLLEILQHERRTLWSEALDELQSDCCMFLCTNIYCWCLIVCTFINQPLWAKRFFNHSINPDYSAPASVCMRRVNNGLFIATV